MHFDGVSTRSTSSAVPVLPEGKKSKKLSTDALGGPDGIKGNWDRRDNSIARRFELISPGQHLSRPGLFLLFFRVGPPASSSSISPSCLPPTKPVFAVVARMQKDEHELANTSKHVYTRSGCRESKQRSCDL